MSRDVVSEVEVQVPTPSGSALRVRGAASAFTDYVSVLSARFSTLVLSLVTIALSSRILGPTGYATIAYVAILSGLVFAITSAWTAAAVSRYGREELETGGQVASVTWARFVIAAPLLVLSGIVIAGLEIAGALPAELTWSYAAVAYAWGVLLVTAEHMICVVEVTGRMKLSAVWLAMGQVFLGAGLLIILVTGVGKSALTVALLLAGSQLVIAVALAAQSRQALWPPVVDRSLLRRIVIFSVPLIAFTFSQYVITYIDIVVIQMYRSTTDVGVYAVAYRGYTVLQALALASGPVLTPLFVSLRLANREGIVRQFVERAISQMAVIGSVVTGLAAALVGFVVETLLGPSFHGAAEPLVVLLLANVAFFMAALVGPVLLLYERPRAIAVVNLGGAALNVALDFLLIGAFGVGIVGAAVATTCAVVFVWAGYVHLARSSVGLPARVNPVVFAPALVGVIAPLAHASFAIVCLGAIGTVVVGVAVLRAGRMLIAEDAAMFAALDIPPAMKRVTLRMIAVLTR